MNLMATRNRERPIDREDTSYSFLFFPSTSTIIFDALEHNRWFPSAVSSLPSSQLFPFLPRPRCHPPPPPPLLPPSPCSPPFPLRPSARAFLGILSHNSACTKFFAPSSFRSAVGLKAVCSHLEHEEGGTGRREGGRKQGRKIKPLKAFPHTQSFPITHTPPWEDIGSIQT